MKFPIKLTYKNGNAEYYHIGTAKEEKVKAEILIVPGKMLDVHMRNNTKLPLMACAIYKDHPDHPFKNSEMENKNIILIRDEVYRIANKKEYQALNEHEFGHIVHGNVTSCETPYDKDEVLADAFMEQPERMKSLTKKWTIYNHKNCEKCKTKMVIDNDTVEGHWFLYCPKCGFWVGDGRLSMFYIEKLVCKRLGKKMRKVPSQLQFLLDQPILTYDQNVVIEKIIAEAKKLKAI